MNTIPFSSPPTKTFPMRNISFSFTSQQTLVSLSLGHTVPNPILQHETSLTVFPSTNVRNPLLAQKKNQPQSLSLRYKTFPTRSIIVSIILHPECLSPPTHNTSNPLVDGVTLPPSPPTHSSPSEDVCDPHPCDVPATPPGADLTPPAFTPCP